MEPIHRPPIPAHGHRHSHAGVELVFDSGLGVYLVVDRHNHFYTEGRFYRYAYDGWQISTELEGGWHQVARPSLPPGLAKKHKPDKGDQHGNKGDQHGDKGDQHGNKGDQHGNKGDQRGTKATSTGTKATSAGTKATSRGSESTRPNTKKIRR